MEKKNGFILVFSIALLITGGLVGAGILGLPVNTGIDGFVPSLIAMFVFGGAMFFSAVVLGKEACKVKVDNFNYPSLYHKYLGNAGKWVAIAANMLILYGLLTAYLTGGATIVNHLFRLKGNPAWILLCIFALLTFLTLAGISIIRKYNIVLMLLLWGSFAVIVFMGERHVEPVRLEHTDWGFLPVAIPIIVTSFHFHNIIPNVCSGLKWQMPHIWKAMLAGMLIGYIMNAIWIEVGVGALPLSEGQNSILYAFEHNIPATVPMAQAIRSPVFTTFSMLFALLAIATSYIANGLGLMGFNRDLTENFMNKSHKALTATLTFGPPLVIAYLFPNIFLKAINLVGGVGIVILFGILPSIICLINSRGRKLLAALAIVILILFSAVLVFQIAEEAGFVKMTSKAEHVKNNVIKNLNDSSLIDQPDLTGTEKPMSPE